LSYFIDPTYYFLFKVLGKHTLLIITIIIIITLFFFFFSLHINANSLRFPCVYYEQHQITYKVHTRHIHIYTHIYESIETYTSPSLSLFCTLIRVLISIVLYWRNEEEEEEYDDRSINCHYTPTLFRISQKRLHKINSTNLYKPNQ
jgi:hypothetical protein